MIERCPDYDPDFDLEVEPLMFKDGVFTAKGIIILIKDATDEMILNNHQAVAWINESF